MKQSSIDTTITPEEGAIIEGPIVPVTVSIDAQEWDVWIDDHGVSHETEKTGSIIESVMVTIEFWKITCNIPKNTRWHWYGEVEGIVSFTDADANADTDTVDLTIVINIRTSGQSPTITRHVTVIPPSHVEPEISPKAWLRIEPRCRSDDFMQGLQARTADPLWMLARQWQTGEFQGEDAGSPIKVQVDYALQALDRIRIGEDTSIDLGCEPLERIVEREESELDWRKAVQAGQQFERLLRAEVDNPDQIIEKYRKQYPIPLPIDDDWIQTDYKTQQFLQFMQGRALNGRQLISELDFSGGNNHQVQVLGDIQPEQLNPILDKLKDWCDQLNIRPVVKKPAAWRTGQLDYRFEINPPEDGRAQTHLIAPSYRNGNLDWYTFNADQGFRGTWEEKSKTMTPTHIRLAGCSPRWWAFEDAVINIGALEMDKSELIRLMLMEFMLVYGDDWFSVSLPVPIANLVKIGKDQFSVKNVFGEILPISPARKPNSNELLRWELFTLSPAEPPQPDTQPDINLPGVGDITLTEPDTINSFLLIPPVTGFREESDPLEEIHFLRGEGANMVWGVEHFVRDGLGRQVRGFDIQRERHERQLAATIAPLEDELDSLKEQLKDENLSDEKHAELESQKDKIQKQIDDLRQGPQIASGATPRYRLATLVPDNWIPFIPADASNYLGRPGIRLLRAQMLRNTDDEDPTPIPAMSRLLEMREDPLLWLEEATVPRSGLHYQLTAQRIRWLDGKTYVWLGRKVLTGYGGSSSGLKFDVLQ